MAALREDQPLVAQVNEDWDELTTGSQIMRPDWDFSPNSVENYAPSTSCLFRHSSPRKA